jgi:hypothetical protein
MHCMETVMKMMKSGGDKKSNLGCLGAGKKLRAPILQTRVSSKNRRKSHWNLEMKILALAVCIS